MVSHFVCVYVCIHLCILGVVTKSRQTMQRSQAPPLQPGERVCMCVFVLVGGVCIFLLMHKRFMCVFLDICQVQKND